MLSRMVIALALFTLASVPATAQQPNCPNGKCLLPQRGFPSAPAPVPAVIPQQMPGPITVPAGPEPVLAAKPNDGNHYEWENVAGRGWGWTQKTEAPPVVGGPLTRLTRKVVCERLRTLAIDRAVVKGIPRAEARKKIGRISDEQILGGAVAMGAPVGALGDGTILRWLWEHRDEIVRWILSILSLFGDDVVD